MFPLLHERRPNDREQESERSLHKRARVERAGEERSRTERGQVEKESRNKGTEREPVEPRCERDVVVISSDEEET